MTNRRKKPKTRITPVGVEGGFPITEHVRGTGGQRRSFKDKLSKITDYVADDMKRVGKYFFTFAGEKENPAISSYSSTDYLTLMYIKPEATTKTGIDALIDAVIDQGHMSGNMKEVVDAEKTAYKTYWKALSEAFINIALWEGMYSKLDAPTETDDWSFSAETGPGINTLESMRNIKNNLMNRKFIIPKAIVELTKLFNTHIKLGSEYIVRKKHIPPRYILPFSTYKDIEDIITLLNTAYTNKGLAKLHMDKFGVKYQEFDLSMLQPREINIESPEAMELLQVLPIRYYDDAAMQKYPLGNIDMYSVDTGFKFYFIGEPSSPWFALAPLIQNYEADHNPYGQLMNANVAKTTNNYFAMGKIAFNGTTFAAATIATAYKTIAAFPQIWTTQDELAVAISGTTITDQDMDPSANPLLMRTDVFVNSRTVIQSDMNEWLIEFMIGITF